MPKSGLIVEGGGSRGVYSAGILDAFIEEGIDFNYVMGISIGAYNAASYLSKQKKRTFNIYKTFHNDKRFIDVKRVLKKQPIMDADFVFNEINKNTHPFDYDSFFKSEAEFISVATDIELGEPIFLPKSKLSKDELDSAIKASCSLPFLTDAVSLNEKKLLDGGIALRLPLEKAFKDGNEKMVVILHTPKGECIKDYITGPLSSVWYHNKYPKLKELLYHRAEQYNKEMKKLLELEKIGKVYIIAPKKMELSIISHDIDKYEEYYRLGIKQVKREKDALLNFLKN